jgi:hypothetical protein
LELGNLGELSEDRRYGATIFGGALDCNRLAGSTGRRNNPGEFL